MSMTITYACDGCGAEMEQAEVSVDVRRPRGEKLALRIGDRKFFCSEKCARDFVFADFAEKEAAA